MNAAARAEQLLSPQFRQQRLTRDQIQDIVRRYETGQSLAEIATAHATSISTVHYQITRRCVLRRDRHQTNSCGTPRGYRRHIARKEPTCSACRGAHATELREYTAARRQTYPPRTAAS